MAIDPSAGRNSQIFSNNPSYMGAWICYINKIEVPITGFSIELGVWQIPQFTIDLIPDPMLTRLGAEDRVPVEIFYLDYWMQDEPTWRLLVDGEIAGWHYSNTPTGRRLSFRCIGGLSLFEQLHFFYMTNVDDIVAAQAPNVQAGALQQPSLLYPYSLFHQGLITTPEQVRDVTRGRPGANTPGQGATSQIKVPYEMVYNVIKGVIARHVPQERRSVPAVNFFARHVRKIRLHNRFVRFPKLEDQERIAARRGVFPIFNAAQSDEALVAMQRQMASQAASDSSVWETLQNVLSLVYLEIATVPNPAPVLVSMSGENEGRITAGLTKDTPLQASVAPEEFNGTPGPEARHLSRQIEIATRTSGVDLDDLLQRAGIVLNNRSLAPEDYTPAAIQLNLESRNAAANQTRANATSSALMVVNPTTPIRLAQHFVKPHFYFSIPPACNVIYPSMITSMGYSEDYRAQPTRVYINDAVMSRLFRGTGPQHEFMMHALTVAYPEEAAAVMHHRVETTHGGTGPKESGRNLLIWPEEYYKGPVTQRFTLPSWFQMLRQFSNANGGAGGGSAGGGTSGSANGQATTPAFGAIGYVPEVLAGAPSTPIDVSSLSGGAIGGATRGTTSSRTQAQAGWSGRWRVSQNFLDLVRGGLRVADQRVRVDAIPNEANWPVDGQGRLVQAEPTPAVRILMGELERRFSDLLLWYDPDNPGGSRLPRPYIGVAANANRRGTRGNKTMNPHLTGRAVDIHVMRADSQGRPVVSGPNPLRAVDAIANFLAANAAVYGIQYIIWARSQWNFPDFTDARGRPQTVDLDAYPFISHYTTQPTNPSFDHIDHIHIEFNLDAYYCLPPVYSGQASTAPAPNASQLNRAFSSTNLPSQAGMRQRIVTPAVPAPTTNTSTAPAPVTTSAPGQVSTPGAPATPATPGTTGAVTTPTGATAPTPSTVPGETFGELFKLYAEHEYLRARYQPRQLPLQLRFNPYLVTGFPSFVFDSMQSQMHATGYVQNINHAGSVEGNSASMQTTATLICTRTFPEFINDLRADAQQYALRVTAAPAEIIGSIREVMQDEDTAEQVYRDLLYGAREQQGRHCTARIFDIMGYTQDFQVEDMVMEGMSVSRAQALTVEANDPDRVGETPEQGNTRRREAAARLEERTSAESLDPNKSFSPKEPFATAFDNYHVAMQLAARPACTLEEFIRFWHSGATVADLLGKGYVEGEMDDFVYDEIIVSDVNATTVNAAGQNQALRGSTVKKPAIYYRRIGRIAPGPGEPPTEEQQGFTHPPDMHPTARTVGLPATYPSSRADWDRVLLRYADKVRRQVRPNT